MSRVVSGRATIRPMNPSKAPHTDSDKRRMAGLSPMALPIILGVSTMSVITCTTLNTITAEPNISHKFSPVSTALRAESSTLGITAPPRSYRTPLNPPIRMPRPMAIGKPMMVNPMQNKIPIHRATRL